MALVIATGVNSPGEREVLGLDVRLSEVGAFRLSFACRLVARGLCCMRVVTIDADGGLKAVITTAFRGRVGSDIACIG